MDSLFGLAARAHTKKKKQIKKQTTCTCMNTPPNPLSKLQTEIIKPNRKQKIENGEYI